jgi:REP element-mobilizing transposase RayT
MRCGARKTGDACLAVRLNDLVDEVATEHEWQIVARVVTPDHVQGFCSPI